MLALRTSTSLSALALLIGVAGTSWLTALTYERAPKTRGLAEVTMPTAAPARVSKTVSSVAPAPVASHADGGTRRHRGSGEGMPARTVWRTPVVSAPPSRAPAELVPVYMPSPRYPMSALRARREGRVVLSVTVTPEGDVAQVAVGRSSGDEALDRAAEEAVRGWRFATADDRTERYTADLPVNFQLTRTN
ncbi:energy transducer TonB [Luteibacter yeojuensis]|uniref:Energy transducer TonB n=1 Tax=Luteibacter yeojuensis TaxID=345309 RepID=A0A7X5TR30_9GAMM|nr:energy transducer TonB [Luteibacter yeojuensis]NID16730.1 energy transducer TonB [Luteibacter yeojuensis]